ncbi:hypothetical protein E2542_SST26225 [Spatholobus suberectus]|nr:hypothetical protein E2542_SST26225 [Spatholobus suberectus]
MATKIDRSASRRFACIPVPNKHDTKNSATKAIFYNQELAQNWVVPHPPKRTFSKVLKAAVFETILYTRARNKTRYGQNCSRSKRDYSVYKESSLTSDEKQAFVVINFQEIKAPEMSSSISSSNLPVSESKNISKKVPKLPNAESKAYKNSRRDRSGRSGQNKERSWLEACEATIQVIWSLKTKFEELKASWRILKTFGGIDFFIDLEEEVKKVLATRLWEDPTSVWVCLVPYFASNELTTPVWVRHTLVVELLMVVSHPVPSLHHCRSSHTGEGTSTLLFTNF